MLATMDLALAHMEQEYDDILDNFWQAYMPIFGKQSSVYQILLHYFINQNSTALSPLERKELAAALNQIRVRDSRIQWIGIYSRNRETNYILQGDYAAPTSMPEYFPYLPSESEYSKGRIIFSAEDYSFSSDSVPYFVICGNDPTGTNNGKLIIGYSLNDFVQTSDIYISGLSSIRYCVTYANQLLFDSSGSYDISTVYLSEQNTEGAIRFQGEKFYIKSIHTGDRLSCVSYMVP